MHIHGNPMAVGVHTATASGKTASAQRGSETRKKLMNGGSEIDGASAFGELLMVGRWPEESSGERQEQPQPRRQKQTQADERVPPAQPVSFCA